MVAGVGSVCVATAMVIAPASAAETRDSNETKAFGACSQDARWEAEMEVKANSLKTEFEVKSSVSNESWSLTINRNNVEVYSQTRSAYRDSDDSYAEVSWKAYLNKDGWAGDNFDFIAANVVSGETCTATISGQSLQLDGRPNHDSDSDDDSDWNSSTGGAAGNASATGAQNRQQERFSKRQAIRVVRQHDTSSDCWSIVGKGVYDLTDYVKKHPGGQSLITAICGRNGTKAFKSQHSGDSSVSSILSSYKVGTIRRSR